MRELDRVIGYEGIKQELYRIIDIIRDPAKYKSLGVSAPKGILLSGEPGIGKTLMAKSFIKETGLKVFVIRKDRPDGDFVDLIRETFKEAEKAAPSIVLLDDLDKFANEDDYHRDAEEYVTVQACIDDVKESDVFVLGTCNNFRKLPNSLVRSGRFDKTFFMNFPGIEDAKKTLSSNASPTGELGGGTANLQGEVRDDIRKAVIRKIFHGTEVTDNNPVSDRRLAVHEAGHAVLSELFFPGQVAFVSIEADDGGVRGMVHRNRDEHRFEEFKNVEIEIMIDLAGKAATELILNEIDMGVGGDLQYDFHAWCHGDETSQKVYDHLDNAAGTELSRYYLKTKQMLGKNRGFLEALIEMLLEKKMISYKDIAPIREKYADGGDQAA